MIFKLNLWSSQVLRSMCEMNPQIFKSHLRDFYPSITRLVCCDQVKLLVKETSAASICIINQEIQILDDYPSCLIFYWDVEI